MKVVELINENQGLPITGSGLDTVDANLQLGHEVDARD